MEYNIQIMNEYMNNNNKYIKSYKNDLKQNIFLDQMIININTFVYKHKIQIYQQL